MGLAYGFSTTGSFFFLLKRPILSCVDGQFKQVFLEQCVNIVQRMTGWNKRDVTEGEAAAFKHAVEHDVGSRKGVEGMLRPRRVSRELTGINKEG
jgi:hypothetical protein